MSKGHTQSGSRLDVALDSIERDRREPDKVLCHLASARRALFDMREMLISRGGCDCTWDINDDGEDVIVRSHVGCPIHA